MYRISRLPAIQGECIIIGSSAIKKKLIRDSGLHLAFVGGAPPVSCSVRRSTSQEHSSVVYFWGAFEGLFGTGIIYYLSLWYHRTEMGVRVF
jgi:hypothetical protein